MANKVSHDFVPNLTGRADPIVEQAIRDLYTRFYKFSSPTTIINQAPQVKKTLIFPGGGSGSGGGGVGTVAFNAIAEGYAMFTVEDLTVTGAVTGITEIDFVAATLDETDLALYGHETGIAQSPAFDGTTDPFYGKPTVNDASRFGRHFAPGDYFLINDAHNVPASYEIMKFDSLNTADNPLYNPAFPTDAWIIRRGQFGTAIGAHDVGCVFYRLIVRDFTVAAKRGSYSISENFGVPGFQEWAWANKCVAALAVNLRGTSVDGTVQITSLIPASSSLTPPCPGLRTMNGACYGLGITGTPTVGKTADKRFSIQSYHSIRTAYGLLRTPMVNGVLNIAVIYISPDRTQAGLIDNILFSSTGSIYQSYPLIPSSPPTNRVMPYHTNWSPPGITANGNGWPPNVLPACSGALSGGNLVTPFTVGSGEIYMLPDGEVDLIVTEATITGSAGKDLDVYFQT